VIAEWKKGNCKSFRAGNGLLFRGRSLSRLFNSLLFILISRRETVPSVHDDPINELASVFLCVCPVTDHEFRRNSGTPPYSYPVNTVTSLLRPLLFHPGETPRHFLIRRSLLMRPSRYYGQRPQSEIPTFIIHYNFSPFIWPLEPVIFISFHC